MRREYKVQKGESLNDVIVKLYGSLEYQTKFLIDNNLMDTDIANKQLYNVKDKIVLTCLNTNTNNTIKFVLTETNDLNFSNNTLKYFQFYDNTFGFIRVYYFYDSNIGNHDTKWVITTQTPGDDTYYLGTTYSVFPFYNFVDLNYSPNLGLISCEPYFEPFTVIYDDSIRKKIVPPITTSQVETSATLKTYKTETNQSFFDVSLITTGGLNNIIALAYQNNANINTFNSIEKTSISYYINQIENRISYNFMQTLAVKPATSSKINLHINFDSSFDNSFN